MEFTGCKKKLTARRFNEMDQAFRLRALVKSRQEEIINTLKTHMKARVIAIASGKGGVGKSNFATNIAISMQKLGKRVIIIDTDFGLANVEILMGINPKYTVIDVLHGKVEMEDALTIGPLGCMFLSGGSGISDLSDITNSQLEILINGFAKLDVLCDCIIVDTRAGISNVVINFIKAASETILITTPDPTAVADAYSLVKYIKGTVEEDANFKLVINCVESVKEAEEVRERLSSVCETFLNVELKYLGHILYDKQLVKSVRSQKPVSIMYPNALSSLTFKDISAKLLEIEIEKKSSIQSFVLKLIGRLH